MGCLNAMKMETKKKVKNTVYSTNLKCFTVFSTYSPNPNMKYQSYQRLDSTQMESMHRSFQLNQWAQPLHKKKCTDWTILIKKGIDILEKVNLNFILN